MAPQHASPGFEPIEVPVVDHTALAGFEPIEALDVTATTAPVPVADSDAPASAPEPTPSRRAAATPDSGTTKEN